LNAPINITNFSDLENYQGNGWVRFAHLLEVVGIDTAEPIFSCRPERGSALSPARYRERGTETFRGRR
jgi:hypothetical protein